jgi:hypothetical protein
MDLGVRIVTRIVCAAGKSRACWHTFPPGEARLAAAGLCTNRNSVVLAKTIAAPTICLPYASTIGSRAAGDKTNRFSPPSTPKDVSHEQRS